MRGSLVLVVFWEKCWCNTLSCILAAVDAGSLMVDGGLLLTKDGPLKVEDGW